VLWGEAGGGGCSVGRGDEEGGGVVKSLTQGHFPCAPGRCRFSWRASSGAGRLGSRLGEELPDILLRLPDKLAEHLWAVDNLGIPLSQQPPDLAGDERLAAARRSVEQHAPHVLESHALQHRGRIHPRRKRAPEDAPNLLHARHRRARGIRVAVPSGARATTKPLTRLLLNRRSRTLSP
jgi:hypothetical protein